MELFSLLGKVRVDGNGAITELDRIEKKAKFVSLSFKDIVKKAVDISIGVAVFKTINRSVATLQNTVIGFNSQLEQTSIGFTTMFKSANTSKKLLEDLKDFAAKTPFEFPELLEATQRMKALGFEAEDLLPTLKAVGDATAGLGGGKELMERIILALGQMKAKGKVSGEEMRQLAEAGIPAYEMLAEVLGVSIPKAMEMTKKGVVSSNEAVSVFIQKMEERFPNMMKNMENTWQGATSTIRDNLRFIIADITKGGYEKLKNFVIQVKDLTAKMYDSFKQGGVKQIYKDLVPSNIKEFLDPIISSISRFYNTLRENWSTIKSGFGDLLSTIAPVVQKIIVLFVNLGTEVVRVLTYISNHIVVFRNLFILLGTTIAGFLVANKVNSFFVKLNALLNGTLGLITMNKGAVKGLAVAILDLKTAPTIVEGIKGALSALNLAFLATPLGKLAVVLSAVVGLYLMYKKHIDDVRKQQEMFNNTAKETHNILKQGISVDGLQKAQEEYQKLNSMLETYKKNKLIVENAGGFDNNSRVANRFNQDYNKAYEVVKQLDKQFKEMGFNVKLAEDRVNALAVAIQQAEREKKLFDQSDIQGEVQKYQEYSNTVSKLEEAISVYNELSKKTKLTTDENARLTKAINTLTFTFGENVVIRDKTGKVIGLNNELLNSEIKNYKDLASETKKATLAQLADRKMLVQSEIKNTTTLIDLYKKQLDAIYNGLAYGSPTAFGEMEAQYKEKSDYLKKLQMELDSLTEMFNSINSDTNNNKTPISSTTPSTTKPKTTSDKNEALQKALNDYQYLKNMGKLTYEQEINMLNSIMSKYAKTTEEKRDLEVKIHDLQVNHAKELQDLWNSTASGIIDVYETIPDVLGKKVEEAKEKLSKVLNSLLIDVEKTGNTQLISIIKSLMSNIDSIVYDGSKSSADKFLKELSNASSIVSSKLSNDAKDIKFNLTSAFREAVAGIKNSINEIINSSAESIDRFSEKVYSAIENYYSKKLEEDRKSAEEAIKIKEDETKDLIDKEKERVNNVIAIKQREIDAINALEQQMEDDASVYKYDQQILELKAKLDETVDPQERWKIQQDIAKTEHDKIIELKKQEFRKKKDILKSEIDAEKDKSDKTISNYENELENFKKEQQDTLNYLENDYYPKMIASEKNYFNTLMLDMGNHTEELKSFLTKYNEDFAIVGQTLGEKMYNGIKTPLDLIKQTFDSILDTYKTILNLKPNLENNPPKNDNSDNNNSNSTGNNSSSSESSADIVVSKGTINSYKNNSSSTKTPSYTSYSVKKGDTLSEIAQKFHTTVNDLVKANNIKNPNLIYTNQTLKIPKYHEGGIVGKAGDFLKNLFSNLKNNEIPAILEVGEMVIPKKFVNNFAFAGVPNTTINNRNIVINVNGSFRDGNDVGERIAQTLKRYGI